LFENFVFYSLCIIVWVVFLFLVYGDLLYFLQLELYKFNSVFVRLKTIFFQHIYSWVIYLLCALIQILFDIENIFLIALIILLVGIDFILPMIFVYLKSKVIFTNRMKRIVGLLFLLTLIFCIVLLVLVPKCYVVFSFPILFIASGLLVSITLLFLWPIEKLIGFSFVKKAKLKLSKQNKLIKIGITGSYGKTSVKEILHSILNEYYCVLSTPHSFNTPFGITRTINENLKNFHQVFVCEMGAKKKGEIKELCNLIGVEYGIVTAVGRQHTNTFHGIRGVYETKKELPDCLMGKPCVFNLMNRYTYMMYSQYKGDKIGVFVVNKVNYCLSKTIIKNIVGGLINLPSVDKSFYFYPRKNNYYAKNIICTENGSIFDVYCGKKKLVSLSTYLLGEHNVINILLAIALAKQLSVPNDKIVSGVKNIQSINARLQKFVTSKGAVVLNNGYNSNIDSAMSILKVLSFFRKSHKIVVTPGLIETENDSEYNIKFGKILSNYCTGVILVKEKNRNSIIKGLSMSNFDLGNVRCVESFADAKKIIDEAGDDAVFLIENDLPDNYK